MLCVSLPGLSLHAPYVGVNLYLSAPGADVLPPHTDPYDVFILQLWGSKTWTTCVPLMPSDLEEGVKLSDADRAELYEIRKHHPDGCTAHTEEAINTEGMECTRHTMGPGNALYMPKGVVHFAHTSPDQTAAHLTIALPMKGYTMGDLFHFLAEGAETELPEIQELVESGCNALQIALKNSMVNMPFSPKGLIWRMPLAALNLPPPCGDDFSCMLASPEVAERVRLELQQAVEQSEAVYHLADELEVAFASDCKLSEASMTFVERLRLANGVVTAALAGGEFRNRLQEFLSKRLRFVSHSALLAHERYSNARIASMGVYVLVERDA